MVLLFPACVLLIEIAVVLALLRMGRRHLDKGATATAFFIGVTAACSMGLAVQGSFLWLAQISTTPELVFVAFWLMVGLIGFAIGTLIESARAAIAFPCAVIALIALGCGILLWDEMAATVAAVLTIIAIATWSIAGRLPAWPKKRSLASERAVERI
jgi:hypothetical protein